MKLHSVRWMKVLLFCWISLCGTVGAQPSAAAILDAFRQESERVLKPLNGTLEKQAVAIAAQLIRQGDTEGANLVSVQVKAKLAGEEVPNPHASVALLFQQYQEARARALKPVQERSLSQLDSALKQVSSLSKESIPEFSRARQEIESGKLPPKLGDREFPEIWTWHLRENVGPSGTIRFKKDGTLEQQISGRAQPSHGTWRKTGESGVYQLELAGETCPMRVEGDKAVVEMSFGTRFLFVKPD